MTNVRSSVTLAHQASGITVAASRLRQARRNFFEPEIMTVTGAGTLPLGDVLTPREILFKLISGDDVKIGSPGLDPVYFLRLSGVDDFTHLRLDVESYVEISEVTAAANTANVLGGTYFTLIGTAAVPVRVWFNTTATGAAPVGGRSIYVVLQGDETAAQVQTAMATAINGDPDFIATKVTGTNDVRIACVDAGARTEIDDDGATGLTMARVQEGATMPLPVFESVGTSEVMVCVASV